MALSSSGASQANLPSLDQAPSSNNLQALEASEEEEKSSSRSLSEHLSKQLHIVPQIDPVERMQKELFAEERYKIMQCEYKLPEPKVVEWRMKDRMRTVSVALVACLNIGVDPPDVAKPQPCARLECWEDPLGMPPQKALDTIGNTLQAQYERWQPRARYKQSLDPTLEDVRKLCVGLRRAAKEERVLFHYNGHGVPRPTSNGEIWVFNKNYTQYIPLSLFDVQTWISTPSIYVFDCSAAALILESFIQYEAQFKDKRTGLVEQSNESILLLPCGPNELLPHNPEFPADLFTSCLTTPIKTALRWFASRSVLTHLSLEMIDKIPGRLNDRKTPLGEINWIFTAITDTIAWSVLPTDLFQKLFRQDLLLASLFRNYLLAERILKSVNCNPVTKPKLSPMNNHPMWYSRSLSLRFYIRKAWDLAAEFCMSELDKYIRAGCTQAAENKWEKSTFYSEQLTAFEVWLQFGLPAKKPMQLPVVLQVLLSQSHRQRALYLLKLFLDKGKWAVDLALGVGIFPYILRLLQSPAAELKESLVAIWAKIMSVDMSCKFELVKDEKEEFTNYFLSTLTPSNSSLYASSEVPSSSVLSCFILAGICDGYLEGQKSLIRSNPWNIIKFNMLAEDDLLRRWCLLLLAALWSHSTHTISNNCDIIRLAAIREGVTEKVKMLTKDSVPEVRAAACFAITAFISNYPITKSECLPPTTPVHELDKKTPPTTAADCMELMNASVLLARAASRLAQDASPLVRFESLIACQAMVALDREEFSRISTREEEKDILPQAQYGESLGTSVPAMFSPVPLRPSSPLQGVSNEERNDNNRARIWKIVLGARRDTYPLVAQVALNISKLVELSSTRKGIRTPSVDISLGGSPHKTVLSAGHFNRHKLPAPDIHIQNKPINTMMNVNSLNAQFYSDSKRASLIADDVALGWKPILSLFFAWSCSFFQSPMLAPILESAEIAVSLETQFENKVWRLQKNQSIDAEGFSLRSSMPGLKRRFDDQIAIFQTEFQETSAVIFHPYEPMLIAADNRDKIGLWNYEDGDKIHVFSNNNAPGSKISSINLVNDLHVSLILSGTDDGVVKVWRNPHIDHGQELVTSFVAMPYRDSKKPNMVVDWQQNNNRLLAGGNSDVIRIWDFEREQCILETMLTPPQAAAALQSAIDQRNANPPTPILKASQAPVSPLNQPLSGNFSSTKSGDSFKSPDPTPIASSYMSHNASQSRASSSTQAGKIVSSYVMSMCSSADGNLFVTGCNDGTVRIFDIRCPQPLISALAEHRSSVIKVHLQRGAVDGGLLISGGSSGDVVHADLRNLSDSVVRIAAHSNSDLHALAVHDNAPIIASGSHKQFIKVFHADGDPISMIRHHDGFLGQRIGPVSALAFHKNKLLLAAGALDSYISIYSGT